MKTDIKNANWLDYLAMAMLPLGLVAITLMALVDLGYRVAFNHD